MEGEPVIGIDLGTSYSRVAVYHNGKVEIVLNDQGNRSTPSYLEFTDDNILIGEVAKNNLALNLSNSQVIFDAKRLIGRKIYDYHVQRSLNYWPFDVLNDCDEPKIRFKYKGEEMTFLADEILSILITELKKTAESYLGTNVFKALISVPACFNLGQRQAILKAVTLAGLNVLRIMNEPKAAVLAYSLQKQAQGKENVLFFDLGGGNLNIAVVRMEEGSSYVKAYAGDTHLGGVDFDIRMVDHFIEEFKRIHKQDISVDKAAVSRLRTVCEMTKQRLSVATQANIQINSLFQGIDFYSAITRTQFEEFCSDLFESILVQVEKALEDATMDKSEISEVVLLGGSTRIPKIQELLQDYFDGQRFINLYSNEAVVSGAAIQAAILNGETNILVDKLIVDVEPLSLGIETADGLMTTMIKRNYPIPTKHAQTFTTCEDNQSVVCIKVFEGESPVAKLNILLDKFELRGIPPAPKGQPQIEVTFEMDANGILDVSAVEKSTGIEQRIIIKEAKGRFSRADFVQMFNGVEKYEEYEEKGVVLFESDSE